MKIIAIVGPTASGKSALGVYLAQKLGGEIISADSRQVYRGLNIGTGKVTKREMGGIPHHLLDVANPKKQFSASDFEKAATRVISGLIYQATPKLPIVVGGTGLYVDVLLGRVELPDVPPNPALRAALEKKSVEHLFAMLKKKDPMRAKTIEPKHKRRLIRALEIASGQSKSILVGALERDGAKPEQFSSKKIAYPERIVFVQPEVLWLGLDPGEKILKKNIHSRLLARMRAGMVAEAQKLHNPPAGRGLSYKRMHELGLEYKFLGLYLEEKITKNELLEQLERAIYKYAKRQKTWFKRNKDILWVKSKTEALQKARRFVG